MRSISFTMCSEVSRRRRLCHHPYSLAVDFSDVGFVFAPGCMHILQLAISHLLTQLRPEDYTVLNRSQQSALHPSKVLRHYNTNTQPNQRYSTMSSQAYVYIPNLVGRQMLRIPVIPCEEADYTEQPQLTTTSAPKLSLNTTSSMPSSRELSPSLSVDELE
ncbi:hypothetical protein K458DRAFT_436800 [Lentithecium fluviatile CBS 122367]|uniref:Uncharacterized protein n=1 Tax=Lentithecium fluviatile CBS 122367 TaxID=1168545 RepID=A0A6G1IG14_9PLEO|nr:hypothetical protein K458DRAFT_436800 [Lentithecium fluviatile CBS 122367]